MQKKKEKPLKPRLIPKFNDQLVIVAYNPEGKKAAIFVAEFDYNLNDGKGAFGDMHVAVEHDFTNRNYDPEEVLRIGMQLAKQSGLIKEPDPQQ